MARLVFLSLHTSPHTQTNHDGSSGVVLAGPDVLYTQTSQPGSSGVLITIPHHFHTPDKLTRLVWCFITAPLLPLYPRRATMARLMFFCQSRPSIHSDEPARLVWHRSHLQTLSPTTGLSGFLYFTLHCSILPRIQYLLLKNAINGSTDYFFRTLEYIYFRYLVSTSFLS